MKKWINNVLRQFSQPTKQLLCLDMLRVHLNKEVIDMIKKLNFDVIFFHTGSAKDLSQLDNSIFAAFKKKLSFKKFSNFDEKIIACEEVWNEITEEQVINYFRHCQLIPHQQFQERDGSDVDIDSHDCNKSIIFHFTHKTNRWI
jgi:hypothetical protein